MTPRDADRSLPEAQLARQLVALPRQRTQLLPALLMAQASLGYVSDLAIERIASHLRLTVNDVEGVATSYPELRRRPQPAHTVRVCTGLSCWIAGSEPVLAALQAALAVRAGPGPADGRIVLAETGCCFLCAVAPVVEMNGVCLGRMTPDTVTGLVTGLDQDQEPVRGASH